MRVIVKQHCDEAMGEHAVQDFVTGVYRAVEGKTRAFHTMARPSHGEPWVELYVGRTIVSCRAILYDDLGELAEYNPSTGKFCTMMASGNTLMPYKLI